MSTERIVKQRCGLLKEMESLVTHANTANRRMEEIAHELEQLDRALLDESRSEE